MAMHSRRLSSSTGRSLPAPASELIAENSEQHEIACLEAIRNRVSAILFHWRTKGHEIEHTCADFKKELRARFPKIGATPRGRAYK